MVRIRDPLHGTIVLSDLEEKILDTWQMQRLRGVRQLAMAYLVYPGANHTRFEHSIGTLALSDKICRELNLPPEKTAKVRLAALLHDAGHTAFSHEAESVLQKHIGNHEEIGERLTEKGEIADVLSGNGFSPSEIARLHHTPLGEIITSDIGADRMDYLLRDSHYTGVAYGVVDADRIASTLSIGKEGIMLQERGLEAAESLLVARFTMFSTVYLHKTVRIASRMLQHSISLAIGDGTLAPQDASQMTDFSMLATLSRSAKGGDAALRLKERRLYKKACSLPLEKMKMHAEAAEEELSQKCGCTVLVDIPRLSLEASIKVQSEDGSLSPISSASKLVASLQKMQRSRLEVLVVCEEKNIKKVALLAKKILS